MKTRLTLVLFLIGSQVHAGSNNACGGKQVGLQVWQQHLTGDLRGRTSAGPVSARIDSTSDAITGFALSLKTFGSLVLDLGYTPIEMDTRIDSTAQFTFGGVNFGVVMNGTLQYDMPIYEAGLRWIALDNKRFRLCLSGNLKVAHPKATVSAGGQSRSFDHVVPIPMLGLSGQVNITDAIKVYGSYKFLDLEIDQVETGVEDWELGLIGDFHHVPLVENLRTVAGFRKLGFSLATDKGSTDEIGFDLAHQGPFVEVAVSF